MDCESIRTISLHFGVCLPMNFTSIVCHQFLRARTDGLPIGDGLYSLSGIKLFLPLAYRTSSSQDIPAAPSALDAALPKDCCR
jgi:hypothetical protein